MNNYSPLPAAASDSRLSSPEAMAPSPDASDPVLQARRQKLRRVVAWVVGGATLLTCAGLVRAAIRSHSERAALDSTSQPVATTPPPVSAAAPALPLADPAQAAVQPQAASSVSAAAPPKRVKKVGAGVAHTAKSTVKTPKRAPVVKSAIARH